MGSIQSIRAKFADVSSRRISATAHASRPFIRTGRIGPFSWHAQARRVCGFRLSHSAAWEVSTWLRFSASIEVDAGESNGSEWPASGSGCSQERIAVSKACNLVSKSAMQVAASCSAAAARTSARLAHVELELSAGECAAVAGHGATDSRSFELILAVERAFMGCSRLHRLEGSHCIGPLFTGNAQTFKNVGR